MTRSYRVFVDSRWRGSHGIARFSTEVLNRLTVPVEPIELTGSPWDPLDFVRIQRLKLSSRDLLYSPGYNAGLTRASQALTIHDLIHLQGPDQVSGLKRTYYERIVKPTILDCGTVMTVSGISGHLLKEWLGASRTIEVVNVGNGVSQTFKANPHPDAGESDFFLYVGNAKPHKNLGVLMRALAIRNDYRLTCVVPRSDMEVINGIAEQLGVRSQIAVHSELSDERLAELYRRSRGLLFPSVIEGFGLPVAEALACGSNVAFSSACLSAKEIAEGYGYSVSEARDPDAWAEAMDALAAMPTGPRVSVEWRTRYSWPAVASRVDETLSRISESLRTRNK